MPSHKLREELVFAARASKGVRVSARVWKRSGSYRSRKRSVRHGLRKGFVQRTSRKRRRRSRCEPRKWPALGTKTADLDGAHRAKRGLRKGFAKSSMSHDDEGSGSRGDTTPEREIVFQQGPRKRCRAGVSLEERRPLVRGLAKRPFRGRPRKTPAPKRNLEVGPDRCGLRKELEVETRSERVRKDMSLARDWCRADPQGFMSLDTDVERRVRGFSKRAPSRKRRSSK